MSPLRLIRPWATQSRIAVDTQQLLSVLFRWFSRGSRLMRSGDWYSCQMLAVGIPLVAFRLSRPPLVVVDRPIHCSTHG